MTQTRIRRYIKHGTLPQLGVFEAVSRLNSYTRAAEELYMAQPTVSVQMKKLTETMGLPLIEQIGKNMHLTGAGRVVHATCIEIFESLARMEATLASMRSLDSGRLQLAVCTPGKYFAPRVLAEFVKAHPNIEVSLQIHNTETLLDRMSRNLDDLYIFSSPPVDLNLVTQVILPNPIVPYAHAAHPLAAEKRIPFARFAAEPFLMREPGSGTRMIARQIFADHECEPRVRMELSTNEAIKQAIMAGLGVSIMSRYTLGLDVSHEQLAILDVEGFPVEHNWVFAYPVGKQLPATSRGFMEFTRRVARTLVFDHLSKP